MGSVKCEDSSNFDSLTEWTTKGFVAFLIDTAKPETPDETCWSLQTSILCETSSNVDILTTSKRKGFVASPIDTAKLEESQRLKRRHVGA